jgi:hypothetical protein
LPAHAPDGAGLVFGSSGRTAKEINAGLDALEKRFGQHVSKGTMVLGGFSLGAIVGTRIISEYSMLFPFAVLAEGGQEQWSPELVRRFGEGGGRRVLFACSTGACETATRPLLTRFENEKIEARYVSAGKIGHLVDDRVVRAIRPEFQWLVRDDPRYAAMRR